MTSGTTPSTRPLNRLVPVPLSACMVDCAVYVDGVRLPGRWTPADVAAEVRRCGAGFVRIGLYEPGAEQIRDIAETLGLHELAVEDAVRAHQRSKLERYENMLFMVLKTVHHVANESPTTANEIVDDYLEVSKAFECDIYGVELVVFAPRSPVGAEQMYMMKRRSSSCVGRWRRWRSAAPPCRKRHALCASGSAVVFRT